MVKLPDEGSNPNIQSQNLSYYHYTIGQWAANVLVFCAKNAKNPYKN
jgi:hypothetical protein